MPRENQDREGIVAKAIRIVSEEERAAYIAQACRSNSELQHQVEEQVAAHFHNGSHREPNRGEGSSSNSSSAENGSLAPEQSRKQAEANPVPDDEQPITHVGPYKVVKQIGEGPSSIVYQVEQQEPVQLKAALKVIKHGPDWRQVVARFEAERQVLSRMDHANIAKLIGAGTHQSGQPYFLMELVDGPPLTKYCDEHQQSLQERLELFLSVCQAVQYAHQKGVLHGDLRPSNVLVSNRDGKPAPKVLDLGIARAVRRLPSPNAPSNGPEIRGDKREYLSPEQANPNEPDLDTRSDVYSLGVLLYELATGTTPLTAESLKDVSRTETLRMIREEEVPAPSARLDESKDRLASVAAKRQMKPEALLKAVKGDLDCVVMKALAKDRANRYDTVKDLIRDLQRYQGKEPVEACPRGGIRAQLRTAARKYPRAVIPVMALLLFLFLVALAGAGLAAWEWRGENKARKAEQEAVADDKKSQKEVKKLKGKLERAKDEEKTRIKERDRAREQEGEARRAEQQSRAILGFLKNRLLATGRPGDVSLAKAFWAGTHDKKDAAARKDLTLRQAVDEADSHVGETFADRPLAEASVREMLGLAYLNLGDAKAAVEQYERAFELRKVVQGDAAQETADARNNLAVAYRLASREPDASRLFHHDPNSPTRAAALAIRGLMLLGEKKSAQAEQKLRESLTIRQKIQPDDWTTFETKSLLGEALFQQKRYAEAEPLLLAGYHGMKKQEDKIPAREKLRLLQALERLVRLYETWDKPEKASKWRKELTAATPANEETRNPKSEIRKK